MAALSLFPSRVRVVDQNGFATPEFLRALNIVYARVGGAIGDSGIDVLASGDSSSSSGSVAITDVVQPALLSDDSLFFDLVQQPSREDSLLPDVVQPASVDPVTDSVTWSAPVTKTADFTVADDETNLINNKSGSTCTVTLPAAASYSGRPLVFQNYQAQTLVSASSNVVPIGGGAAGTAILAAVAGNWAMLVSDGTNWVVMSQAPNNILLLE